MVFGLGPAAGEDEKYRPLEQFEQMLSSRIGGDAEVMVTESYPALLDALEDGDAAAAWLPPAVFVKAHDELGAELLLASRRVRAPSYLGVLFVRADSPYRSPEDLEGASAVWVDPSSCAGYLFPRWALLQRGIDPRRHFGLERMLGSHRDVVTAVSTGKADVGATFMNMGASLDQPTISRAYAGWSGLVPPDELRPILTSPAIPNDVICAGPGVDEGARGRLSVALRGLHKTVEGQDVLEELFQVARFEHARIEDYGPVRAALHLIP